MERAVFWKACFWRAFLFVWILLAGMRYADSTKVASAAASDVGKVYSETEGGKSRTGVLAWLDSDNVTYIYDQWIYSAAGGWQHDHGNVYGLKKSSFCAVSWDHPFGRLLDPAVSDKRIMLPGANYRSLMGGHPIYMIETVTRQKGIEINREYEYSTDTPVYWASGDHSLMLSIYNKQNLYLCDKTAKSKCYEYFIWTGFYIRENTKVGMVAPGAVIQSEGEAYCCGDGRYKIRKLPTVSKPKDRNRYVFQGWYADAGFSRQVAAGDCISSGGKIYAKWQAIPEKCDVTCVDICRTGGSDLVLGSSAWKAEFGDTAHGSEAGSDKNVGTYYKGRTYTGCSSATVKGEGTTVYRYFQNAPMTVTCIDVVNSGPGTGQQMGTTVWEEEYTATANGATLGSNKDVGAYYKGYRYTSSTSQQVGENGCTVYRYFSPVRYDIEFVMDRSYDGSMPVMEDCYYGQSYQLPFNSFINRNTLYLSLNAEDAVCDTSYQSIYRDFKGWSGSASGSAVYSDGCTVKNLSDQDGTVKLYAVWSEKEVDIDAQPKRLGYEFAGWSEDSGAQSGRRQFKVDGDMVLYAIWHAAPVDYHVEYYKQKPDKSYELAVQYDFSALTGTTASVGDLEDIYPGFVPDRESSRLSGEVKADGTLILNVFFRRGEYTIQFDANGGDLVSGGEEFQPVTDLFEQKFTLPDVLPERKGYLFAGWAERPEGGQILKKAGEEYSIPNHDQTLYAYWIPRIDTRFSIIPYYENLNGIGYMEGEQIELQGRTDSSLLEGLLSACPQDDLDGNISYLLGNGYYLPDGEKVLQGKISADGDTAVELYLLRKRYELRFLTQQNGVEDVAARQEVVYGQNYIMPQKIEGIRKIYCYQDQDGKIYYPGDTLSITGEQSLMICQNRDEVQGEELPALTQRPEEGKQPPSSVPEGTIAPGAEGPDPVQGAEESSAPGQTCMPLVSGEAVLPTVSGEPRETVLPIVSGEPCRTALPTVSGKPRETALPTVSRKPRETALPTTSGKPQETALPATSGKPRETALPTASGISEETAPPTASGISEETAPPTASGISGEAALPATTGWPGEGGFPSITKNPVENVLPVATEEPGENILSTATEEPGESILPAATEEPERTDLPSAAGEPEGTNIPATSGDMTYPMPSVSGEDPNASLTADLPPSSAEPGQEGGAASSWIGPDKDAIASVLRQNADAAFPKKGSKLKRGGLVYRVLQAGISRRTLRVVGITKAKRVVRIPDQLRWEGYSYQVTQIKKGALSRQKKIKKIILGKNIKKIGKNAFADNRKLKKISFRCAGSQIQIGAGAWSGCAKGLQLTFAKGCSSACRQSVLRMRKKMSIK